MPGLLQAAAAWSWRLLLTGLVLYLAFRLAVFLRLVTLPFIAAMLATALLQPFVAWLRRRGFSPLLSTWCTFFLALVVIAGAITLLANQISSQYPVLFDEVQKTANQLQHSLAGPPFHVSPARLSKYTSDLLKYISQHKSVVAGTVLTGGSTRRVPDRHHRDAVYLVLPAQGRRRYLEAGSSTGWRPEAKRRMPKRAIGLARAGQLHAGTTVVAAIHSVLLGLALGCSACRFCPADRWSS